MTNVISARAGQHGRVHHCGSGRQAFCHPVGRNRLGSLQDTGAWALEVSPEGEPALDSCVTMPLCLCHIMREWTLWKVRRKLKTEQEPGLFQPTFRFWTYSHSPKNRQGSCRSSWPSGSRHRNTHVGTCQSRQGSTPAPTPRLSAGCKASKCRVRAKGQRTCSPDRVTSHHTGTQRCHPVVKPRVLLPRGLRKMWLSTQQRKQVCHFLLACTLVP